MGKGRLGAVVLEQRDAAEELKESKAAIESGFKLRGMLELSRGGQARIAMTRRREMERFDLRFTMATCCVSARRARSSRKGGYSTRNKVYKFVKKKRSY